MKRITLLLALLCAFALSAKADVFNLTINSAPYNDGHFAVGPYNSTITYENSSHSFELSYPLITYCVDFESHVNFGQTFEVQPILLSDFHGPLLQNYLEAAWIYTQMLGVTDVGQLSLMQRAAWLITSPGSNDSYLLSDVNVFNWTTAAFEHYSEINPANVTLFLKVGEVGQNQIALNSVPEPSTWAMAGVGFLALIGFNIRRNRA